MFLSQRKPLEQIHHHLLLRQSQANLNSQPQLRQQKDHHQRHIQPRNPHVQTDMSPPGPAARLALQLAHSSARRIHTLDILVQATDGRVQNLLVGLERGVELAGRELERLGHGQQGLGQGLLFGAVVGEELFLLGYAGCFVRC